MNALAQDIRFALRTLWKTPAFTAIALLALALGIGANSAIFTVVNTVLLHPLPFPDSKQICEIHTARFPGLTVMDDRTFVEFEKSSSSFEHVAAIQTLQSNFTGIGEPIPVHAATVTPGFWPVLKTSPVLGRTFRAEDKPESVIVISDQLWRSHFNADRSILGKVVNLDATPRIIIGVMSAGFAFPAGSDAWTPLKVDPQPGQGWFYTVIGRLKDGVSVGQASAETKAIAQRLDAKNKHAADDAGVISLHESLVGQIRPSLYVLLGAVGFILLIACANVANLLLARGASRRQEVAVRASLGASRMRLVRQLLTESTLLALCGGAVGLLLCLWAVPVLIRLTPDGMIPRLAEVRIDSQILAFTFGLSVATSLLFGAAPAIQLSKARLADFLRQSDRRYSGAPRLRNVLVVGEIALSLVLLIGAGLMIKSFALLRSVNPGFNSESALTLTVNLPFNPEAKTEQLVEYHKQVLDKFATLPSVTSVGAIDWLPFDQYLARGDFYTEAGSRPAAHFDVSKPGVSPDYFRAIGIRLLRGRLFNEFDSPNSSGVAIVSDSVARQAWGDDDPIGKRLTLEDHPKPSDWLTVVGVVDDVKQRNLAEKTPVPAVYQPMTQVTRVNFLLHMAYVVRANGNTSTLARLIRARFHEIDPNQPIQSLSAMDDLISATTAEPRFYSRMLGSFSAIALLLASLGIYGVMAYSVVQRTREIGIRVALGAQRSDIFRAVMTKSALLALAGVALGLAGAFGVTRVLQNLLFDVKPTDTATFGGVSVLLILVTLAATYIPARRATSVDPMVALRYE
jgi:predicted permease